MSKINSQISVHSISKIKMAAAVLFLGAASLAASAAGSLTSFNDCKEVKSLSVGVTLQHKMVELCPEDTLTIVQEEIDTVLNNEEYIVRKISKESVYLLHVSTKKYYQFKIGVNTEFLSGDGDVLYQGYYRAFKNGKAYFYISMKDFFGELSCQVTDDCVFNNELKGGKRLVPALTVLAGELLTI